MRALGIGRHLQATQTALWNRTPGLLRHRCVRWVDPPGGTRLRRVDDLQSLLVLLPHADLLQGVLAVGLEARPGHVVGTAHDPEVAHPRLVQRTLAGRQHAVDHLSALVVDPDAPAEEADASMYEGPAAGWVGAHSAPSRARLASIQRRLDSACEIAAQGHAPHARAELVREVNEGLLLARAALRKDLHAERRAFQCRSTCNCAALAGTRGQRRGSGGQQLHLDNLLVSVASCGNLKGHGPIRAHVMVFVQVVGP